MNNTSVIKSIQRLIKKEIDSTKQKVENKTLVYESGSELVSIKLTKLSH